MALCDALRMMFSRQYASSASCQTQPFHALSCRRRGWRLRKLLQSVVFSVTHPFWKASTGRMWSMAAFAHVIFEWGYRRFHALRLVSKCSYTCSARQYRAQQHQAVAGGAHDTSCQVFTPRYSRTDCVLLRPSLLSPDKTALATL